MYQRPRSGKAMLLPNRTAALNVLFSDFSDVRPQRFPTKQEGLSDLTVCYSDDAMGGMDPYNEWKTKNAVISRVGYTVLARAQL
jgi:hypothetical protein